MIATKNDRHAGQTLSVGLVCCGGALIVLTAVGCTGFPSGLLGGTSTNARATAAKGEDPSTAKTTSKSGVYSITFGVRSGAGKLGAVQFDARPRAGGQWQGSGAKVACTTLLASAMTACNEKSGGVLSCGLINPNGFSTPTDLVRCEFRSGTPVAPSDFSVKVVDSSDTAAKPVGAYVLVTDVKAR